MSLAAGPKGTVLVADHLHGRVLLLRPWPDAKDLAGGYSIEAIAGSGVANAPLRKLAKEAVPFDRSAGARPRLPEVLRREIGSFLIIMDPRLFNFRAALALEAIRTDSPEPDQGPPSGLP